MTHLATVERVLDVRRQPAAAAAAEALARFDALEPGDRFVLLGPDAGGEVLRRLQRERTGLFEWSPLELGPAVWRTEIARREAPKGATRGVYEALAWDHDRLDALEAAAFRARAAGDLQAAFDVFAEFAVGLRRHIGFEDELLFSAFEAKTGMPPSVGPTAVMREEHREIERLLEEIAAGIGDAAAPVETTRAIFLETLGEHNVKEEKLLYPMIDEMIGAEDADRLVRQIQGFGS